MVDRIVGDYGMDIMVDIMSLLSEVTYIIIQYKYKNIFVLFIFIIFLFYNIILEPYERKKAKERQLNANPSGKKIVDPWENFSKGRSLDHIAGSVGISSENQNRF